MIDKLLKIRVRLAAECVGYLIQFRKTASELDMHNMRGMAYIPLEMLEDGILEKEYQLGDASKIAYIKAAISVAYARECRCLERLAKKEAKKTQHQEEEE